MVSSKTGKNIFFFFLNISHIYITLNILLFYSVDGDVKPKQSIEIIASDYYLYENKVKS